MKLRKRLIIGFALLLLSSIILPACSSDAEQSNKIKLGLLEDRSGDFSLVGMQKYYATQLAVDEINKNGGLLGKKIEIVAPDTQSDNKRYQEMARKLILDDKVDVIMGGFTSASREAIRPIMEQYKMLYFYNNQYEGGVASKYTFCTGVVPEHQVITLIEYMIKTYGPKAYIIAADYNFGQITADWVKVASEKYGGKVIGEEFIPLGVSQFSDSISRIQKAKPDYLVVLLTGAKQSSFYEQWRASGIKNLPMATTINIAQQYEHKRFKPPALANMHIAAPFVEELDTPQAKEFVKRMREKFPDIEYVGMEAEAAYTGVYLWAKAVEKAGTTEVDKVIQALESGISVDAPSGKVTIDPKTHHAIKDVYLIVSDKNHDLSFPHKWKQVRPYWLSDEKGIDLTKEAPNKQFTPLD